MERLQEEVRRLRDTADANYRMGWNAALEAASVEIANPNKSGREWVPGSLWDSIQRENAIRLRSLKRQEKPE